MEWNPDNVQPEQPVEETEELAPAPEQAPEPVVEPEAVAAESQPEPEPETTSLLKKEISFRRKPKEPEAGARARGREVLAAEEGDLVPAQAQAAQAAEGEEGEDAERAQAEGRGPEEGDLAPVRPQEE